jgi:hypothetical protein
MASSQPSLGFPVQIRLISAALPINGHARSGASTIMCEILNQRTGEVAKSIELRNTANPYWHQSVYLHRVLAEDVLGIVVREEVVRVADPFIHFLNNHAPEKQTLLGIAQVTVKEAMKRSLNVLNHVCVRCGGQVDVTGRAALRADVPLYNTSTESSTPTADAQTDHEAVSREASTGRPSDASRLTDSGVTHTRPTRVSEVPRLQQECCLGQSSTNRGTSRAFLESISYSETDQLYGDQHLSEPGEHLQHRVSTPRNHNMTTLLTNQTHDSASPCSPLPSTVEQYLVGARHSGTSHPDSTQVGNLTFCQIGNQISLASRQLPRAESAVVSYESRRAIPDDGMDLDICNLCSGALSQSRPITSHDISSRVRLLSLLNGMACVYSLSNSVAVTLTVVDRRLPSLNTLLPANAYKKCINLKYTVGEAKLALEWAWGRIFELLPASVNSITKLLGQSWRNCVHVPYQQNFPTWQDYLDSVSNVYPTWKIEMHNVDQVFSSRRQPWNRDHPNARKIFENGGVRAAVKVQHAAL